MASNFKKKLQEQFSNAIQKTREKMQKLPTNQNPQQTERNTVFSSPANSMAQIKAQLKTSDQFKQYLANKQAQQNTRFSEYSVRENTLNNQASQLRGSDRNVGLVQNSYSRTNDKNKTLTEEQKQELLKKYSNKTTTYDDLDEATKLKLEQMQKGYKQSHPEPQVVKPLTEEDKENSEKLNKKIAWENSGIGKNIKNIKENTNNMVNAINEIQENPYTDYGRALKIIKDSAQIGLDKSLQGIGNLEESLTRYVETFVLKEGYKPKNWFNAKQDLKEMEQMDEVLGTSNENKGAINSLRKNIGLDAYRNKLEKEIVETQAKLDTKVGKHIGELLPSLTQNGMNALTAVVNPTIAATLFSTSAYQGYYEEAREKGLSRTDSEQWGLAMAYLETVSEEALTFANIRGFEDFAAGKGIKNFLVGKGANITENALQEGVMQPSGKIIENLILGKSLFEGLDDPELWKSSLNEAVAGAESAAILDVLGTGASLPFRLTNQSTENQFNSKTNEEQFKEYAQKRLDGMTEQEILEEERVNEERRTMESGETTREDRGETYRGREETSQTQKEGSIRNEIIETLQENNITPSQENINRFMERASNFLINPSDTSNPRLKSLIQRIQDSRIEAQMEQVGNDFIDNDAKIWYNPNGINLEDSFYEEQLDSALRTNFPNLQEDILTSKEFGDNYYLFAKNKDGSYTKYLQMDIEKNRELINNLSEVLKNESITKSGNISEIIESMWTRQSNNNNISNNIEQQSRENESSSGLYTRARQEGDNRFGQNSERNIENSYPEIENTQNERSLSLQEIKDKYKEDTDVLNIFENKNAISLGNLVVKKELRNKGKGQQILNDIIDYANKTGKTITLTPTSEFNTKEKLKKWYKANGFVENKGKNTDFTISDTMYKLADTKKQKDTQNERSFSLPQNDNNEYSLSDEELKTQEDTSEENEIDRKINQSMTMKEAEEMVQRAFVAGNIRDWYDGKYKNGREWLEGEGIDEVAMWIDNDYDLQQKYINSNDDILNEEYLIDDVLEAYKNGTLIGKAPMKASRLDVSKDTGYKDDRFYAPKQTKEGIDLYNKANTRVTNANRQEIYKARADFIINAQQPGYIESLGIDSKEALNKMKQWAGYNKTAFELSNRINKDVSMQNRWSGIENSSIVNNITVSDEQMKEMVKEVKGNSSEYERKYITSTMLAIDCHTDFSNLTFDFVDPTTKLQDRDSVLGQYNPTDDVISIRISGQNTVSHEIGHYLDHLFGRQLFGNNRGITDAANRRNIENKNLTDNQKQFIQNFSSWFDGIESSADIGSKYKMEPTEVFARFVARFTEWTKNVATNNRYGYESKWYDDHFTNAQYIEFTKLLQEKSLLDTTEEYKNYNKKNYGSGKTKADAFEDFIFETEWAEEQKKWAEEKKQNENKAPVKKDIAPKKQTNRKQTETVENRDILDTTKTFKDGRDKQYYKYKRQTKAYDNSSLQNAMNLVSANYQGRRDVEQWLQIAKQIGTEDRANCLSLMV